jgi:hypothetical protein
MRANSRLPASRSRPTTLSSSSNGQRCI